MNISDFGYLESSLILTAFISCVFCLSMVIIYIITYDKENYTYSVQIITLGICDFLFSFCKG